MTYVTAWCDKRYNQLIIVDISIIYKANGIYCTICIFIRSLFCFHSNRCCCFSAVGDLVQHWTAIYQILSVLWEPHLLTVHKFIVICICINLPQLVPVILGSLLEWSIARSPNLANNNALLLGTLLIFLDIGKVNSVHHIATVWFQMARYILDRSGNRCGIWFDILVLGNYIPFWQSVSLFKCG